MLLKTKLSELAKFIVHNSTNKSSISSKGVDWHIDHSLKVIIGTYNVLKKSNAEEYKWHFNMIRLCIFSFNFIPGGKGKAPRIVTSKGMYK